MRWLVTGANRGIGAELVAAMRARGFDVVATVRRSADPRALERLGARVETWDAEEDGASEALARRLADVPLDGLVANAGVMGEGESLGRISRRDLEHVFRVDTVAPLLLAQALLPNLRAAKTRRIAAVTSRMGSIADNSSGGYYAYRAAKAALNAAFKSLSIDLAGEGFTCVVLHPGWVRTRMGGDGAPMEARDSAARMMAVLDRLHAGDNGRFFGPDGEELPW